MRMLRILWILPFVLVIGAHEYDSWKSFFENLSRELSRPLQKTLPVYPEVSSEVSHTESPWEDPCESDPNCYPDSSKTSAVAPEVVTSKLGTLDDYIIYEELPGSSSQQSKQQVGSTKGTPGENFPDYTDIPATSFSCSDQDYVPGFYADLDSGCQVFHACWPHRMESFLCPVGTTFNQALLACDYWYSSNCSLAPNYYNVNGYSAKSAVTQDTAESSMMSALLGAAQEPSEEELHEIATSEPDLMAFISQFLPVKAKVTVYPETADSKSKIVATASVGKRKKRERSMPESRVIKLEPQSTTKAAVSEETEHCKRSPGCPEIIKYINVEEAVKLVFERLESIVKNIIREAKEYMEERKVCSMAPADKIIPVLTKIKHKLVPKPLVPPVIKDKEPVITTKTVGQTATKTDATVDQTSTKPPVAELHKKPIDSRIKYPNPKQAISPWTKKALVESYLKLLKLRKS